MFGKILLNLEFEMFIIRQEVNSVLMYVLDEFEEMMRFFFNFFITSTGFLTFITSFVMNETSSSLVIEVPVT